MIKGQNKCEQITKLIETLRTRVTTSTRFDLKFFRILSKNRHPGIHLYFFSPERVALLLLLKDFKTSRFQNAKTSNI